MRLVVLADDLTGAAECQAALWPRHRSTSWLPGAIDYASRARTDAVDVVDMETRLAQPVAAARTLERELAALLAASRPGRSFVYLKFDSALRGHIAAHASIAAQRLDSPVVPVVLANPAAGRTTQHGIQMLDGRPISETAFALDPTDPVTDARIEALFRRAGSGVTLDRIDLDCVRDARGELADRLAPTGGGGRRIVVVDAATDDDLSVIAEAIRRAGCNLVCGSGGLIGHLEIGTSASSHPSGDGLVRSGPTLVAAGSLHPTTYAQITELTRSIPLHRLTVQPGLEPLMARHALRDLRRIGCALVTTASERAPDPVNGGMEIARSLAFVAALIDAQEPLSRLVLIGGNTAYHVARELGVRYLTITGLADTGVPICQTGPTGRLVVLKPGGFGSHEMVAELLSTGIHRSPWCGSVDRLWAGVAGGLGLR